MVDFIKKKFVAIDKNSKKKVIAGDGGWGNDGNSEDNYGSKQEFREMQEEWERDGRARGEWFELSDQDKKDLQSQERTDADIVEDAYNLFTESDEFKQRVGSEIISQVARFVSENNIPDGMIDELEQSLYQSEKTGWYGEVINKCNQYIEEIEVVKKHKNKKRIVPRGTIGKRADGNAYDVMKGQAGDRVVIRVKYNNRPGTLTSHFADEQEFFNQEKDLDRFNDIEWYEVNGVRKTIEKKEKIAMKEFLISGSELRKLWGNGNPLEMDGKKYSVNRMSYGDYFMEPWGKEYGETEGFAPGTIWLEKKDSQKDMYGISELSDIYNKGEDGEFLEIEENFKFNMKKTVGVEKFESMEDLDIEYCPNCDRDTIHDMNGKCMKCLSTAEEQMVMINEMAERNRIMNLDNDRRLVPAMARLKRKAEIPVIREIIQYIKDGMDKSEIESTIGFKFPSMSVEDIGRMIEVAKRTEFGRGRTEPMRQRVERSPRQRQVAVGVNSGKVGVKKQAYDIGPGDKVEYNGRAGKVEFINSETERATINYIYDNYDGDEHSLYEVDIAPISELKKISVVVVGKKVIFSPPSPPLPTRLNPDLPARQAVAVSFSPSFERVSKQISISELRELIEQNNKEYGTNFELGGAYGQQELWAGGDRLEVGSLKDVYNAFVKYRFNEKYRSVAGDKTPKESPEDIEASLNIVSKQNCIICGKKFTKEDGEHFDDKCKRCQEDDSLSPKERYEKYKERRDFKEASLRFEDIEKLSIDELEAELAELNAMDSYKGKDLDIERVKAVLMIKKLKVYKKVSAKKIKVACPKCGTENETSTVYDKKICTKCGEKFDVDKKDLGKNNMYWVVEEGVYDEEQDAIKYQNAKRFDTDKYEDAVKYFEEQSFMGKPVYISGPVDIDNPEYGESEAYKKEKMKIKNASLKMADKEISPQEDICQIKDFMSPKGDIEIDLKDGLYTIISYPNETDIIKLRQQMGLTTELATHFSFPENEYDKFLGLASDMGYSVLSPSYSRIEGSLKTALKKVNIDINQLDHMEKMWYDKYMENEGATQEDALKFLVNNVDGDSSQMSDELRVWAVDSGYMDTFDFETEGSIKNAGSSRNLKTADQDEYKEGDSVRVLTDEFASSGLHKGDVVTLVGAYGLMGEKIYVVQIEPDDMTFDLGEGDIEKVVSHKVASKYEYKRVDLRTERGIKEAEKLKADGWRIVSHSPDVIEFERPILKEARSKMTPQQIEEKLQEISRTQKVKCDCGAKAEPVFYPEDELYAWNCPKCDIDFIRDPGEKQMRVISGQGMCDLSEWYGKHYKKAYYTYKVGDKVISIKHIEEADDRGKEVDIPKGAEGVVGEIDGNSFKVEFSGGKEVWFSHGMEIGYIKPLNKKASLTQEQEDAVVKMKEKYDIRDYTIKEIVGNTYLIFTDMRQQVWSSKWMGNEWGIVKRIGDIEDGKIKWKDIADDLNLNSKLKVNAEGFGRGDIGTVQEAIAQIRDLAKNEREFRNGIKSLAWKFSLAFYKEYKEKYGEYPIGYVELDKAIPWYTSEAYKDQIVVDVGQSEMESDKGFQGTIEEVMEDVHNLKPRGKSSKIIQDDIMYYVEGKRSEASLKVNASDEGETIYLSPYATVVAIPIRWNHIESEDGIELEGGYYDVIDYDRVDGQKENEILIAENLSVGIEKGSKPVEFQPSDKHRFLIDEKDLRHFKEYEYSDKKASLKIKAVGHEFDEEPNDNMLENVDYAIWWENAYDPGMIDDPEEKGMDPEDLKNKWYKDIMDKITFDTGVVMGKNLEENLKKLVDNGFSIYDSNSETLIWKPETVKKYYKGNGEKTANYDVDISGEPTDSMWGKVQQCIKIDDGIYKVFTASHGGIMVKKEIGDKLLTEETKKEWKYGEEGWYSFEEDNEWLIAVNEIPAVKKYYTRESNLKKIKHKADQEYPDTYFEDVGFANSDNVSEGLVSVENYFLTPEGLIAKMREWQESEHGVEAWAYDLMKKDLERKGYDVPKDIVRVEDNIESNLKKKSNEYSKEDELIESDRELDRLKQKLKKIELGKDKRYSDFEKDKEIKVLKNAIKGLELHIDVIKKDKVMFDFIDSQDGQSIDTVVSALVSKFNVSENEANKIIKEWQAEQNVEALDHELLLSRTSPTSKGLSRTRIQEEGYYRDSDLKEFMEKRAYKNEVTVPLPEIIKEFETKDGWKTFVFEDWRVTFYKEEKGEDVDINEGNIYLKMPNKSLEELTEEEKKEWIEPIMPQIHEIMIMEANKRK